jgi:hypothetical protein
MQEPAAWAAIGRVFLDIGAGAVGRSPAREIDLPMIPMAFGSTASLSNFIGTSPDWWLIVAGWFQRIDKPWVRIGVSIWQPPAGPGCGLNRTRFR